MQRLDDRRHAGAERLDLDELQDQIRQAIVDGNDGEMRDLARLAISAFGRQGEGSGVVGVDVQRIRRTLDLRQQAREGEPEEAALDRENLRRFEAHLRRELERSLIHRTAWRVVSLQTSAIASALMTASLASRPSSSVQ